MAEGRLQAGAGRLELGHAGAEQTHLKRRGRGGSEQTHKQLGGERPKGEGGEWGRGEGGSRAECVCPGRQYTSLCACARVWGE